MNIPVIDEVLKIVNKYVPDSTEKAKAESELLNAMVALNKSQADLNAVEAASPNLFVSGWRPMIGWIGALAIGYQFLFYPLMTWGWRAAQIKGYIDMSTNPPPVLDADVLFTLITGMLGIAGMRSFDKLKGTAR